MKTPTLTKPKPTAATIRQINAAHDAVVNAARDALQNAMRAGELLVAVKDGQDHGDWEIWLANNCPNISDRTARLYMRLSKNEDKLTKAAEENGNAVADLSVREAQKLLAKPLSEEEKAARAANRAAKAAAAQSNKSTSPDLKNLVENCAVDEIGKALHDADKLDEFEAAAISRMSPDKLSNVLIKAWGVDEVRELSKRLTEHLATVGPSPQRDLSIPPALRRTEGMRPLG
jgi:hypothetical protein